jgi:hypothetical protein
VYSATKINKLKALESLYFKADRLGVLKMAHKKAGGSSKNGRDSNAQRRGVKRYGG